MKRGRKPASQGDKQRFAAIKEIGCIACRMYGFGYVACEVHHLTVGGKHGAPRRGHEYTVGLCTYHHRGEADGYGHARGPSYAKAPKAFRATFGPDEDLLAKQNELIALHMARTGIRNS